MDYCKGDIDVVMNSIILLCKLLMLFSLVVGFFELEKYFESEFKVPNGAQPDILEKLKRNPF